ALPARHAEGLELLALIRRELRLRRLVGADAGDGSIGLELLDVTDLRFHLRHVDRLRPHQTHEIEPSELPIGAPLDPRPRGVHAHLLERAHLLRGQPQLLLVTQGHEDDGASTTHVVSSGMALPPASLSPHAGPAGPFPRSRSTHPRPPSSPRLSLSPPVGPSRLRLRSHRHPTVHCQSSERRYRFHHVLLF